MVECKGRGGGWTRIVLAAGFGVALIVTGALASSATYDEAAYLRIASTWWRGGDASEITRMGSPLTFFKLQAGPVFFVLDRLGLGRLIDGPDANIAGLLACVRIGGVWLWLAAFAVTVAWSRRLYGPRAATTAAWMFAISPNLVAHGGLMTMETPLLAASTACLYGFWLFLTTRRARYLVGSAAACGLAFSCKFTAILLPPIVGLAWLFERRRTAAASIWSDAAVVAAGMAGFVAVMIGADLAVTGFATVPLSPRTGDHPSAARWLHGLLESRLPSDWVGFATQCRHQANGGASYLVGERRQTGWWYYYPVALAVKVPLGAWTLIVARVVMAATRPGRRRDWFLPLAIGLFLVAAMAGSKRNYGVRYLLPIMPLAIVWTSRLAESRGVWRMMVAVGLAGQAVATAAAHPHELSYFNSLAGGVNGGRMILADSNLDWGQGLRSFERLERAYPDTTLFYFGDLDPARYRVRSRSYTITANGWPADLPETLRCATRYVAVSASLEYGPWGPADYFATLRGMEPVARTDEGAIAVYDLISRPDLYAAQ